MDKNAIADAIQLLLHISENVVTNKPELVARINAAVHGLDAFLGQKFVEPLVIPAWSNEGMGRLNPDGSVDSKDIEDVIAWNDKRVDPEVVAEHDRKATEKKKHKK